MKVFEDIGGAVVQNFGHIEDLSEQFLSGRRALPPCFLLSSSEVDRTNQSRE